MKTVKPRVGAIYRVRYMGGWTSAEYLVDDKWMINHHKISPVLIDEIGQELHPPPIEIQWGSDPSNIT